MFHNNELLLLSGNDLPFPAAQVTIHQPTLKEIALIGEESFFAGCELLKFSKDILTVEDKTVLNDKSDFEVFMMILNDNTPEIRKNIHNALNVLMIIFPGYEINIFDKYIGLTKNGQVQFIKDSNFNEFKNIIQFMFCLNKLFNKGETEYNPQGELAKKIADKLAKGRQKAAAAKMSQQSKVAILSRYVSILAVGEKKDINDLMHYTVPQLFDEFSRFELKMAYDLNLKARMAGATDVEDPEDWMKDLYDK